MAQPFRVIDGDDPGRDRGGWDENGNVDLPGTLTVDTVKGSGSSTPGLTTTTFQSKIAFQSLVTFVSAILQLSGETATSDVFAMFVAGDTVDRFRSDASGKMRWGPGNAARDTNLYRNGVGVLKTDTFFNAGSMQSDGDVSMYGANFTLGTAGGRLRLKEGDPASTMGRATLVGGTVVVPTTSVSATSEVFLTCQVPGGTPGFLRISTRTAGTSFTILSSSGTDTSVVGWFIVEPAP